jgi:PAS domain S-box-containing protein/putative nucleotidyltransferase with HDIG domain
MEVRESGIRKSPKINSKANDSEDSHINDVPSRIVAKLMDVSGDDNVYNIIGEGLQEITGVSTLLVFSFSDTVHHLRVRAILGESGHVAALNRLLVDYLESTVINKMEQQRLDLLSGKLVQVSGSLFELTNGSISKDHCVSLLKELDITDVYALGFHWKGQLFGGALLFPGMELHEINSYAIDAFIKHISIILQRRWLEEEMQSSESEYQDLLRASIGPVSDDVVNRHASMVRQLFQRSKKDSDTVTSTIARGKQKEKQEDSSIAQLEIINKQLTRELAETRKREEELGKVSEQLESLINLAPVIIARTDLKMNVKYVNKKFEEVTGYSADEIVGKYWPSLGGIGVKDTRVMLKRVVQRLIGYPSRPLQVKIQRKDGKWIYVLGIGDIIRENGRPIGVHVIAQDVTDRILAEKEAKRSTTRLQKALEGIIQAMAVTVEMRDPYTAGHQRRVATLAYAIAKEIGLPKDRIIGIELAGLIHDLGKIRVPSEILTYPDTLSEAEFNIIRTHPEAGYDILKNIDFPWPIAQIVLQHHERMDGSGYPKGLSGEEIMIESRIIAVADVVEAIASHRPYRQALGIERALQEISENKGILYDTLVVDTCLALFKKKQFKFDLVSTEVKK